MCSLPHFFTTSLAPFFGLFRPRFHRDVLLRQRLIHRDAIARSRRAPKVPPDFWR
jgi:hypothetical protein